MRPPAPPVQPTAPDLPPTQTPAPDLPPTQTPAPDLPPTQTPAPDLPPALDLSATRSRFASRLATRSEIKLLNLS